MSAAGPEFASLAQKAAFERSCAGKQRFPSQNAAEAFARFMKQGHVRHSKSERRAEWDELFPYRCLFSKQDDEHWHLGHPLATT